MNAAALLLMLLLCVLPGSRQLSITEFAVPSAVEAGKNAELQCRHSDERVDYVKWWWTPLYADSEDQNRVLLYQRLTGHPADITKKDVEGRENDTIVLLDLQSHDSGVYECEVSNMAEERRHQELIVFSNGTGVNLNVSKTENEEDLLVECEALEVTPQPELALFVDDIEIENITQYLSGGAEGLYDVFVNLTLSADIAEGATIRCELVYENRNVSHSYSSELIYTSGRALPTTEAPEDTTESEVASELINTSSVISLASRWMLFAGTIVLAVINNFYLMQSFQL